MLFEDLVKEMVESDLEMVKSSLNDELSGR